MTTAVQTYDKFLINVPRIEAKRFRAILNAFGFEFHVQKQNDMDRALEDIEAGRVYTMNSVDDFFNSL